REKLNMVERGCGLPRRSCRRRRQKDAAGSEIRRAYERPRQQAWPIDRIRIRDQRLEVVEVAAVLERLEGVDAVFVPSLDCRDDVPFLAKVGAVADTRFISIVVAVRRGPRLERVLEARELLVQAKVDDARDCVGAVCG